MQVLTKHHASITAIVIGHGGGVANIAVSASLDKTCLVWDYHNGALLHTFLFGSAPLCIALDPVDRALYAGMGDGSIQLVDFYKTPHVLHSLWDAAKRATPTQPPASDRWSLSPDSRAAVQCLVSNYEGTVLLSGHDNGKIHTWDIAKGRYAAQLADFRCGVTNIHMIPPSNFPNPPRPSLILHHVMRPRFESTFPTDVSALASKVPEDYTFNVQFANTLTLSSIRTDPMLSFDAATHGLVLPDDIMREGLLACITATPSASGPSEVGSIFSEDCIDDNAATSIVKKELSRAVDVIQIYSEKVRALEGEIQRRDQDAKRRERLTKTQKEEMELLEHVRRQQEIGDIVDMNDREAMQVDRVGGNSQQLKTI
jgi:pre-rRNA-processing protein IPI3